MPFAKSISCPNMKFLWFMLAPLLPGLALAQGLGLPMQEDRPRLDALQDAGRDFQVALRLLAGAGGRPDQERGLDYLRRAAEGGHPEAQFNLGNYHNLYTGNYREAARWWRAAAQRDHPEALYNLGELIAAQLAPAEGEESARNLLVRAAILGHAPARARLSESGWTVDNAPFGLVLDPEFHPVESGNRVASVQGGLEENSWMALPDSEYSLQIVATRSRNETLAFVGQQRLSRPLGLLTFERGQQRWYALLYGHFDKLSAAIHSASELPPALRRASPWPRRLGAIRALPAAVLEEIVDER